jgi:glycosyltransferase involved in cell wall biosynthesis
MRIAHVTTGLEDGGAEAVLSRLCLHDETHSHIVISLTGVGKYGPILLRAGIPVYSLSMPPGRVSLNGLRSLWGLLKAEQPDVVQTWMYHADLVGGLAARFAGIRSISWGVRQTTLEPGKSKRATIWVAHACARLSRWVPQAIVCCAESAARVHAGIGYEESKLIVVPNGYDLYQFSHREELRAAFREEIGLSPAGRVIGMVARFDPQKDHENLLNALAALDLERRHAHCILVGKGMNEHNQTLMGWILAHGLANRVLLLGPRADIPAVMNALDVHVLSSSFGEGFPNALAEAMACGTPCVATDVGDASSIVGDTGAEEAQGSTGPRGARPGAQDRSRVDLERKTASWDVVPEALTRELALAHRLLTQQRTGANKLYSLHAPEAECISKGKAHKRYEFGVKVGVVASLKKPFILAAHALPGRPYDGHTLMRSLAQATLNTGIKIKTAVADKGYRGHETWPGQRSSCRGSAVAHPESAAGGVPGCAGAV